MSSFRFRQSVFLSTAMMFAVVGTVANAAEDGGREKSAATGEEQSGLESLLFPNEPNTDHPPVQPNLSMFLWTLILFGGFIFVMKKSAWVPLMAGLNAREARVINAERDAKAAREEVETLRLESEARLAEVQEQVKALIAVARSEAEAQKREITSKAQEEALKIKDEALQEIAEAHRAAIENLDQMVDEQVDLATQQVVGRRL